MSYIRSFKRHTPTYHVAAWMLGLCALAASPAALAACLANPNNVAGHIDVQYREHEAGEAITDWQRGSGNYLRECPLWEKVRFTLEPATGWVGTYDGYDTFSTANPNIGVQYEYRYATATGPSGHPTMGPWTKLGRNPVDIVVSAHHFASIVTSQVDIEYDVRFVALNKITSSQSLSDVQPVNVVVESGYPDVNNFVWSGFDLIAPRQASCWFVGDVDGRNVKLPFTHTSMLKDEGDTGPAARFSWSWNCDPGNQGHTGGGDFMYRAVTSVTDAAGRMAVDGDAKGVELLVTRTDGGKETPIVFDRWYGDFGRVEYSGREDLQVRYYRNGDPLKPGAANGGLVIRLLPR